MMPVEIENARLKLALTIPTGAPMTVANDAIEMLPVVKDKTINDMKIVKRSDTLTKSFAHWFSFFNLSNKIIFNFIDFFSLNYC